MHPEQVQKFISQRFGSPHATNYRDLEPAVVALAQLCLEEYHEVERRRINPVEHHFLVFANCFRMGIELQLSRRILLRLLFIALLHDTSLREKPVGEQVEQQQAANPQAREALEVHRVLSRAAHELDAGLFAATEALPKIVPLIPTPDPGFTPEDANEVIYSLCQHDCLSRRTSAPLLGNRLLQYFCEVDSMWLVMYPFEEPHLPSPRICGVAADLWRKDKDYTDKKALLEQLEKNLKNLQKRRIVFPNDAGFCGDSMFTNPATYRIFCENLSAWRRLADTLQDERP